MRVSQFNVPGAQQPDQTGRREALRRGQYYLDLDPSHKTLANPTYGLAFRIVAVPSDAELTGPAFSAKQTTLFFSVQHPREDQYSSWPPR